MEVLWVSTGPQHPDSREVGKLWKAKQGVLLGSRQVLFIGWSSSVWLKSWVMMDGLGWDGPQVVVWSF